MPNDEVLFSKDDLRAYLDNRRRSALNEIDRYGANQLLNSNIEDLVTYFVTKYEVDPPVLLESAITADQSEAKIDVSGRFEYDGWYGERVVVPGLQLTLHIPFSGEIDLLRFRASTYSRNPPRGRILSQEVVLTFESPQNEVGRAKEYFDREIKKLKEHVAWSRNDIQQFNSALTGDIREHVENRRQRLLANQETVVSLGFPLRARPDAPRTYAVPDIKQKIIPTPPPASSAPYIPEPALTDQVYEHILSVLANMVQVMEQSPEAFSTMGEQDLRTHFLVQLNGQFEGRATGETFHGSGRTDILLKHDDRSVFIAECKFWDGPASLNGAIDQILDYSTWRDAKAALLLFSRNADFSSVLGQVPGVIASHPHTRGPVATLGETVLRSQLRQRQDSAREITLTTLVYNVPTDRATSSRLRPRKGRNSS